MLSPVGIEPMPHITSDSNTILSGLTGYVLVRLRSLYSRALLIIAKSSQFLKFQKSIGAWPEV